VFKSHGQEYLVGNRLSKADVHLAEMVYNMEELDSNILAGFPLLQVISFTALTRWGPASPIVNLIFGTRGFSKEFSGTFSKGLKEIYVMKFEVDTRLQYYLTFHNEKDPQPSTSSFCFLLYCGLCS
jgi:hypothetical protein